MSVSSSRLPAAIVLLCLCPLAHADEDRFAITLSGFRPSSTTLVSAGAADVLGQEIAFEDSFDLAKRRTRPRVDGLLRLGERHRLLFNYYNLQRRHRTTLDETISFDGQEFPVEAEVSAKFDFALATLSYEYAFIETPTLTFGASIGAYWAEAKAGIRTEDTSLLEAGTRANGGSPAIGLRLLATPSEAWRFGGYVQAFKANIDEIDGRFVRAGVLAEYRVTKGVGLQLGYDWFRLEADYEKPSWNGRLDLRIHGPTAGFTFAL